MTLIEIEFWNFVPALSLAKHNLRSQKQITGNNIVSERKLEFLKTTFMHPLTRPFFHAIPPSDVMNHRVGQVCIFAELKSAHATLTASTHQLTSGLKPFRGLFVNRAFCQSGAPSSLPGETIDVGH